VHEVSGIPEFLTAQAGGTPVPEGSISKVLWGELTKATNERVRAGVAGAAGTIDRSFPVRERPGRWQYGLLRIARQIWIEEGTSEIQLGMIAERLLGQPTAIEFLQLMMDLAAQ
jgi:hypothetical protein